MQQTRLYQTIANKIKADIKNGIYTVGTKLPPERDLAIQFGVSRTSVREAIIALEVCNIVEVKLGSGVYVLKNKFDSPEINPSAMLDIHPQLLPFLQDTPSISPFELLNARLHIEPYLAELAAIHRSEQQLAEIKKAFLMNVSDNLEGCDDHIGDRLFHIRIAEASQNNVYSYFLKYLLGQQYTEIFSHLRRLYTPEDMPLRSQYEHQEILTAIQNKAPDQARKAMQKHLQHVIQIFSRKT